jgi:cytidylate kinase
MTAITISRQFGSGGDEIALRICQMLGYHYFDKQLMAEVAREVGLLPAEVVDFSEDNYKTRSFLERLMNRSGGEYRTWTQASETTTPPGVVTLDEADSVALVWGTLEKVYRRGNIVIVGRGGQVILKDKPDVLHVRIEAPYKERVQRLLDRENYSPGGAKDAALKHDRASSEYLQRFFNIDWNDPTLYDLVINTGKLSVDTAAHLIIFAVNYLRSGEKAGVERLSV